MEYSKKLLLAFEELTGAISGKPSLGQQRKGVAKSGKGRRGALIDLAAAGSAAAVTSPWGETAGVAKVNAYRKRIHTSLNSHDFDDVPYHVTRDQFIARVISLEWAENTHGWPRIVELMDSNHDLYVILIFPL